MAKRKTRRGGGNPFAKSNTRIAELEKELADTKESLHVRRNSIDELKAELEAARKQYSAYERGEVERSNAAHKQKQMLHREVSFLRETLFRLSGSGYQIETFGRVED